ncbi:MAG TPA: flagellar biosynthesis anti-sigma factor FlgM [Candidatus Ozemobacteraceae bacterium]|nr:flagellar biosynthesis anti-sigma factor FlgM [Candidatus Ozemobacteraceae bacterium]
MKVSRNDIQKIYQEQVKKTKTEQSGDAFGKILKETTGNTAAPAKTFHPPSGLNVSQPVFAGKPVAQAEPVETLKFAAEVVAGQSEIREEKVARIKALFDKGQYNVSPEQVAERMMSDPFGSRHLFSSWEG